MADLAPGTRVLIAEDSPTQAEMLRAILAEQGCAVVVARDGREAIERFGRGIFDIVLSDIVMPGVDGFGLCRHVKGTGRVPVILLTSLRDPLDISRGLDAGADDFLCKPWDPRELVAKVGLALAHASGAAGGAAAAPEDRTRMVRLLIGAFEATARRGVELESANAALSASKALVEGAADLLRREQGNILEAVGEGIIGLDAAGNVTFINPSAMATLGWDGPAVIGRDARELFLGPGREESPVFAVLAGHHAYHRAEAVFRKRTGEVVPVEHTCTPMLSGQGAIIGAVIAFRDISERRRMAAEHGKLEEDLRQSHKMEAIGRLAGGVAHDFNNLLTVILGFSELILAGPIADPLIRERLGQIKGAADHGAGLTRQLLTFSRRQAVHLAPLSPGRTVAGMDQIIRQLAGTAVQVVFESDPDAGLVMGDPGQIGQVLVNLVVNAVDAMPGGGRITIRTADADPALDPEAPRAQHPGAHVVLSVSDTGQGMSPATRERIFEPFFTTKPVGAGTGLGLATVFGIVQQCGGVISVSSAPGRGTTFRVYLPRLDGAPGKAGHNGTGPPAAEAVAIHE